MRARLEQTGRTWPPDGLVFTTRSGRAIEPRAVSRRFDARCAKAGVRRIRVHDTRRTCGSLLAALDVHPRVAMQILRHSKIAITMEIYTMAKAASVLWSREHMLMAVTELHTRATIDRLVAALAHIAKMKR